jgi:hypothetical protein
MSLSKTKKSTRSLIFAGAVLGLTSAGLWFGAQYNTTEASISSAVTAPAATFAANAATLGAVPDGPTGCLDANPPSSRDVTFTVSGISGNVSKVELNNLTFGSPIHTWAADIKAVLIAPNGASHVLFGRTGATTSTACGSSSDLVGPYNFGDLNTTPPSGGWWQASTTTPIPTGSYRSTALGGAGATNPSPATSINPSFTGVTNANGTWTLRLTDHGGGDTGSVSAATLLVEGAAVPASYTNLDMNGDGKTDFVVARATDTPLTEATDTSVMPLNRGETTVRERLAKDRELALKGETNDAVLAPRIAWYTSVNGTGATQVASFGDAAVDFLVPNDYDGDNKTDLAVWRPGAPFTAAFYILNSATNTVRTDIFGQTGDDPAITGDYDGDGKADTATYRCPALGAGDGQCYFYYRPSNPLANPQGIYVVPWGFGEDGDFFVNPGDFDGDGKNDFCIQRSNPAAPTSAQFVLLKSQGFGVEFVNWGNSTDFIIPGDYDGDGKDDFCVRRTVSGARLHYILERDGGGTGAAGIAWGVSLDASAPGDYDGDGKTDIAVWRQNADPTQNFFYVRRSSDNAVQALEWGQNFDNAPAGWNVH